ncbi:carbohydrate kinase family protein [Microbacterium sp. NPDC055683]
MAALERAPRILVVGEALVDIVRRADGAVTETPGGSPANVALTLGRLGRTPQLLSAVGADRRGEKIRNWLAASGVDLVGTRLERTSTAQATLDARGAATYEFAIDWRVDVTDAVPADVLHVGSIGAALDPGARSVSEIVDRHRGLALIGCDPNVRPSLIEDSADSRERMRGLLARADVVKASDEDLAWLYPNVDAMTAARGLLRAGPLLVVMTQGPDGVVALRDDDEVRVPAVPVDVVDTVGAGDTFMGALLDGLLLQGVSGRESRARLVELTPSALAEILHRSALAASITVGRFGADPPTPADLDAVAASSRSLLR